MKGVRPLDSWIDDIKTQFLRWQIRGRAAAADMHDIHQLYLLERMLGGNWRGFGGDPIFVFDSCAAPVRQKVKPSAAH